jgi:hypothetical protein
VTDTNQYGTRESTPAQARVHAVGTRQWHITAFLAPQERTGDRTLLEEIRELRARILFDRGRRPAFVGSDGTHVDDQALDFGAWHFIARSEPGGPPLGYIRLSTPATGDLFQSRVFLGVERYEKLLRARDVPVATVFEHSRLVVEHRARKLGLGILMVPASTPNSSTSYASSSRSSPPRARPHWRLVPGPRPGGPRLPVSPTPSAPTVTYGSQCCSSPTARPIATR